MKKELQYGDTDLTNRMNECRPQTVAMSINAVFHFATDTGCLISHTVLL